MAKPGSTRIAQPQLTASLLSLRHAARGRGGDPGGAQEVHRLRSQKGDVVSRAEPSGAAAAIAYNDSQHPAPTRARAGATKARTTMASWSSVHGGDGAQHDLDDRFQGPIQDARRALLLPLNRARHALPVPTGMSGTT